MHFEHTLFPSMNFGHILFPTMHFEHGNTNMLHAFTPYRVQCCRVSHNFSILTWTFASHRSHVQFLISHHPRGLRARPFGEPTLRLSRALDTNSVLWFFTLPRALIFFLAASSLTPLTTVAASVYKSDIWLLNFLCANVRLRPQRPHSSQRSMSLYH